MNSEPTAPGPTPEDHSATKGKPASWPPSGNGLHPVAKAVHDALSTEETWRQFQVRLAVVLADLEEDDYLIIAAKKGNAYVQFAAQGVHGMRAEAVSNTYLDPDEQLSANKQTQILTYGWRVPTHLPNSDRTASGSPNYYMDAAAPVPYMALATLATETLLHVYGILHPGRLQYRSFNADNTLIRHPALGLKKMRKG